MNHALTHQVGSTILIQKLHCQSLGIRHVATVPMPTQYLDLFFSFFIRDQCCVTWMVGSHFLTHDMPLVGGTTCFTHTPRRFKVTQLLVDFFANQTVVKQKKECKTGFLSFFKFHFSSLTFRFIQLRFFNKDIQGSNFYFPSN